MNSPPRTRLTATYRLQFHCGFTFDHAIKIVPYLARLGVSHLYASPIFAAVPGSPHGYDVTDFDRINPELGGEDGFERLHAALRAAGLGLVLDIVPNHMAASSHNPYWMETLEFGPVGAASRLFDIDWRAGRLLLPVLGDPLRATIAAGTLRLDLDGDAGRIEVVYGDRSFPLRPESVAGLLRKAAGPCPALSHVAEVWAALAVRAADPAAVSAARELLSRLPAGGRAALDTVLGAADLAALLDAQHWRLAWWRTAADDLNYRRFFNITELIGVRVEDAAIFERTHKLVLALVRAGKVDALRVDHIDGLLDPALYLDRLRRAAGPDVPIFVEKILEPDEVLPPWPIDGTTGYERLNDINGLFIDEAGWTAFEADLRARNLLVGTPEQRVVAAKRDILQVSFATELDRLVALARDGLDEAMRALDLTDTAVRRAVVALLAHCPVYRSYASVHGHAGSDREVWDRIRAAIERNEDPLTIAAAGVLLDRLAEPQRASDRAFCLRFQQASGPAMAKGFEDTELYRNMTLLSANEVGGSPSRPWRDPQDVHALSIERADRRARDLIPLATHDTKRGADTRARLNALSQAPEDWLAFLAAADPLCAPLRVSENGRLMPDDTDLCLIHQTLYAARPLSPERLDAYLLKALRESKRHSSWESPDEAYETACLHLAGRLLSGPGADAYRDRLRVLGDRMEPAARLLGLAQTVLQLTLPGTPDIYQGTEFRDFSLVDPDNRRPVDWPARAAALDGITDGIDAADVERFALTRSLLQLRRELDCLTDGDYRPLPAAPSAWRWHAFTRRAPRAAMLVAVPTRSAPMPPAVELDAPIGQGWSFLDGREAPAGGSFQLSAEAPYLVLVRRG